MLKDNKLKKSIQKNLHNYPRLISTMKLFNAMSCKKRFNSFHMQHKLPTVEIMKWCKKNQPHNLSTPNRRVAETYRRQNVLAP